MHRSLSLPALAIASAIAGCSAIVAPDTSRLQPRADGAGIDAGTIDSGPSPCGPGGECVPGTTSSQACGSCGTQPLTCNDACTWEPSGVCSGEGVCIPGERMRSGDGCPAGQSREVTCNTSCVYEPLGDCREDTCTTPGASERVPCGMCGTSTRFCSGALRWEYGPCGMEGMCMPGTVGDAPCGMCGSQAARCNESCTWVPSGACTDEGECAPGTTTRTRDGCPDGMSRLVRCDDSCEFGTEVEPCTGSHPVDVTLLLDVTGSNQGDVATDLPTLSSRCLDPLLALRDVFVGVSYTGEFPNMPYGAFGDRPFEGGVEPGSSIGAITTEVAGRPRFNGSDGSDATVEALSTLAGGMLAASSAALVCSSGRAAGGCWRPGAIRVVVIHTDSPIHNGPDPDGPALYQPYMGIVPPPATWPEALVRLETTGTIVIWLDREATDPGGRQFDEMLRDLGQPMTDHHRVASAADVGAACDAIVARVRALAGL